MVEKVRVFGPASLSNLGPGFDTLGLCLEDIGDVLEVMRSGEEGVKIYLDKCGIQAQIPTDPNKNTAGVAAIETMKRLGVSGGLELHIKKGFTAGSGIGSSAACAAAAAWAVNVLYGRALDKDDLLEAVLAGETVASGARHGDNVLPALLGGLILVSSRNPIKYRKIKIDYPFFISLILPKIQVLTKNARAMLPESVSMQKAIFQASALGFMIDAFREGDLAEVGHWMMQDQLAEPVRADLVPCYNSVKKAALDSGAFGCALTGSGPAMFAISDNELRANEVKRAMEEASRYHNIDVEGYVTTLNKVGARVLKNDNYLSK